MSLFVIPGSAIFEASELVRPATAARLLGVQVSTVLTYLKRGRLRRFIIDDVIFLDRREVIRHRNSLLKKQAKGNRSVKLRA